MEQHRERNANFAHGGTTAPLLLRLGKTSWRIVGKMSRSAGKALYFVLVAKSRDAAGRVRALPAQNSGENRAGYRGQQDVGGG